MPQPQPPSNALAPGFIIVGPTGSGKSALALDFARQFPAAAIINGDSMQVYKDLSILTARPQLDDESIPHHLYGVLGAHETASLGWWMGAVDKTLQALSPETTPLVVGGTGLYIKALLEGISPMPDIPSPIRDQGAALYESLGHEAFQDCVRTLDPTTKAQDKQRLLRAWEVITHSGHPLSYWQAQDKERPDSFKRPWTIILILPDRQDLYPRLNGRFAHMVLNGGLEEAQALPHTEKPQGVYLAIGVPELLAYLAGQDTLEGAITKGQQATRHYAKRQMTWFRHQLSPDILWPKMYDGSLPSETLKNFFKK